MKIDWKFDPAESPPDYVVQRLKGTPLISRRNHARHRLKLLVFALLIVCVSVASYLLFGSKIIAAIVLLPLIFTQPMLDSYEEYEAAWRAGNDPGSEHETEVESE